MNVGIVHLFVEVHWWEKLSYDGKLNALNFKTLQSQSFDPGVNENVRNELRNTSKVPEERRGKSMWGGVWGPRRVTHGRSLLSGLGQ